MSSTYPSYRPDPNDPNRRRRVVLPEDGSWPVQLRWGFLLILGTAVLMIATGLVQLTGGFPGNPDADYAYIQSYMFNLRFTAVWNITAAVILALLAAQLRTGHKLARRWLAAVITLTSMLNLISFLLNVTGFAGILILVLLVLALLLLFRPSSNAFMDREWEARRNA
ncbi:hypothetical protein [Corynebacterium guangdongense]|uniref:Tellurium resistance protein TerC n=1 Tax=Corynebacterium guangdongense TaxID=1783348 RepID=A0ABU1ZU31_9CORY|nr:hypothetical protein [Corynebacterium guangdongense]MDR7328432.1 hypothetical protein [Corynebacterium guangdongense]WJZ17009.1 hypothetical protein CGUA_02045 [Corynebacterium guangdongense]